MRDEAKKFGLDFAPGAFTIPHATVPVTHMYWCPGSDEEARQRAAETRTQTRDLALDGYDRVHKVAYEFVSTKLIDARRHDPCISTVSGYDLKGTAERLRTGLAGHDPEAWIGLFYEPGASAGERTGSRGASETDGRAAWEQHEKAGRAIGEKELREQVRDFVGWLKAQGVI